VVSGSPVTNRMNVEKRIAFELVSEHTRFGNSGSAGLSPPIEHTIQDAFAGGWTGLPEAEREGSEKFLPQTYL
jgi:hypothetical protein